MATFFRGSFNGARTQFVHRPMTDFYRALALRHARIAGLLERVGEDGVPVRSAWRRLRDLIMREIPEEALLPLDDVVQRQESALLAHIYACMAAEAGCNQVAEDLIPFERLDAFDNCKKEFRSGIPDGVQLLVWKWRYLFAQKGRELDPRRDELAELGKLVGDRNSLIHYSLTDSATKLVFDRPAPTQDGRVVLWSVDEQPTRVEPSLVERLLNADAARIAVERAEAIFRLWNQVASSGA